MEDALGFPVGGAAVTSSPCPSHMWLCLGLPSSLQVVDTSKGVADIPEWFKGSRLNYAENLLRHKENDKVALYVASESWWPRRLPAFLSRGSGPRARRKAPEHPETARDFQAASQHLSLSLILVKNMAR